MRRIKRASSFNRFSDEGEILLWVNKHYSEDELIAISGNESMMWYTGSGSKGMSEYLRVKDLYPNASCEDEMYLEAVKVNAFIKQHSIKDNIVVFRFVDLRELLILIGAGFCRTPFLYKGLLSTTLSKELHRGDRISPFCIEILVPKGAKGTYVPEVGVNEEYEILLPFDTRLRMTGFLRFEVIV